MCAQTPVQGRSCCPPASSAFSRQSRSRSAAGAMGKVGHEGLHFGAVQAPARQRPLQSFPRAPGGLLRLPQARIPARCQSLPAYTSLPSRPRWGCSACSGGKVSSHTLLVGKQPDTGASERDLAVFSDIKCASSLQLSSPTPGCTAQTLTAPHLHHPRGGNSEGGQPSMAPGQQS